MRSLGQVQLIVTLTLTGKVAFNWIRNVLAAVHTMLS